MVLQGDGERNFHVFYYLFAGSSKERLAQLSLTNPTEYHYLRGGSRGMTRDVVIDLGLRVYYKLYCVNITRF